MATDGSSIEVREAIDTDAESISTFLWALWEEAGPDAPGLAGATEQIIEEIAHPTAIRRRLGGPERRIFVAVQEDRVVGFAATRVVDESEIELAGIMVLPSLTGRGIGRPLVETAADTARTRGFTNMTVSTEVGNEGALRFYQANGFVLQDESVVEVDGTEVAVARLNLAL